VDYARKVAAELREAGIRVRVDERSESVGRKIRDAELAKWPYMLVVGDEEEKAGAVAVRSHEQGDVGKLELDEFAASIREALASH